MLTTAPILPYTEITECAILIHVSLYAPAEENATLQRMQAQIWGQLDGTSGNQNSRGGLMKQPAQRGALLGEKPQLAGDQRFID